MAAHLGPCSTPFAFEASQLERTRGTHECLGVHAEQPLPAVRPQRDHAATRRPKPLFLSRLDCQRSIPRDFPCSGTAPHREPAIAAGCTRAPEVESLDTRVQVVSRTRPVPSPRLSHRHSHIRHDTGVRMGSRKNPRRAAVGGHETCPQWGEPRSRRLLGSRRRGHAAPAVVCSAAS